MVQLKPKMGHEKDAVKSEFQCESIIHKGLDLSGSFSLIRLPRIRIITGSSL